MQAYVRGNKMNSPLWHRVDNSTRVSYQVDNLIIIKINVIVVIFAIIIIIIIIVIIMTSDHLDVSFMNPGFKSSPSQPNRLDDSWIWASATHPSLSNLHHMGVQYRERERLQRNLSKNIDSLDNLSLRIRLQKILKHHGEEKVLVKKLRRNPYLTALFFLDTLNIETLEILVGCNRQVHQQLGERFVWV